MTRKPLAPFLGYLVTFFLAWTFLWVHGLYPWATARLGDRTLTYALVSIGARLLLWVLPVFAYLRFIDGCDPVEYLQLRRSWKRGVAVGLVLSLLNFAGTVVRVGMPHLSAANVTWNSVLGTSFLVGLFEEIPFRGFILQKLRERFDFWTAAVISSLLFVGIHVPGWAMLGSLTARNAAVIFTIGFVLAVVFRYSRSLWAPIVAHSLNDFMSFVVFRM